MIIFGFDYSQQGWYDYIMKNLYGQEKTISGNTGPIWGNAPEAFGANTFFNSMQNYDEGANIQYMKKNYAGVFNINSVLGYAGTKLTHIDNYKNADGGVSVDEYEKTIASGLNKQAMLEALDVNSDGFIDVAEEAAFTLVTDALDGKTDGVISKEGRQNASYLINNNSEYLARNIENFYNSYTKDAVQDFEMPWNEINGDEGPYDSSTTVGKGANAGAKILDMYLTGEEKELNYSNYQYMYEDENGNLDIDSGLATYTSVMKTYDKDKNGKVIEAETDHNMFDVTDVNNDGELSAGELLARAMVADTNNDGKVSYEEKRAFKVRVDDAISNTDKNEILEEVKTVYTDNSIADAEADFEMPEKEENTGFPPNYGNQFGYTGYQDFYSFFLNLLSSFSQRF